MRCIVTVLVLLGLTRGVTAQETQGPARGSYRISPAAEDRSPNSSLEAVAGRMGARIEAMAGDEKSYDITRESFEAWVPEEYVDDGTWGLLVWVSPGGSGGFEQGREYIESLKKHKLIWVGANNSGNPRPGWIRIGLAVDGAHLMSKRYKLDLGRVYISGVSGGGRVSSMTAVLYPDVFAGGMYIVGCNFYRQIEVPGTPGTFFRKSFSPPPGKLFRDAKSRSRHVLLTGETDGNRLQTHTYFHQGFKKDGFEHVIYLEVPGMGHRPPPADWFEKGMAFLEERPAAATQPVVKEAATRPATRPVVVQEPDEAGRLLRLAKIYVDNNRYGEARERLERIVREYGVTEAGKEAKKLLEEIKGR